MSKHHSRDNLWNIILVVEVFVLVFVAGFLPDRWNLVVYGILYTSVYITSAIVISTSAERYGNNAFYIAAGLILLEWVASTLEFDYLEETLSVTKIMFFLFIVGLFIAQLIKAKHVSEKIILKATTGYLLLGISFSLMINLVNNADPTAFNFENSLDENPVDYLYYGFVTMSTLGYGDLLPLKTHSRSLALLITVCGQLYLAFVVALIIGKFSSSYKRKD